MESSPTQNLPSSPPAESAETFSIDSLTPLAVLQVRALAERKHRELLRQRQQSQPPEFASSTSLVLDETHPYHDLLTPADFKVYYGGRDAAKSWAFAEALIRRARDEPIRWLCTREFQTSIRDSVHKLLHDTIIRLGLSAWFVVTRDTIKSKCGAEFIFKGLHNNAQEIKSTEGLDGVWVEEAQNTSDDSWEVLIPTIRKAGAEIWVSMNITDETAPSYVRFIAPAEADLPPNTIRHKVNYDRNPFLSERSKRAIAYLMEHDFHAYEHVYLGYPKKVSDAVIFAGRYQVEDFPDTLAHEAVLHPKPGDPGRIFYGADFGFARDPSTLIRFFIYDHILYIEFEAWGVGVELVGTRLDDGRGEMEQFYDSVPESRQWPIKGDSSRPETISHMRGLGFNIEAAEKWKGCVEDGIAFIKGFKCIIIHTRCKHMAEEARLYSFKVDPKSGDVLPIIVKKNDHGWDAVRYGLDGYIQASGDAGIWARLGAQ